MKSPSTAMQITVRCYEELNDYLPSDRVKQGFVISLPANASCADVLASIDVPVNKVELIIVNGSSVGLAHALKDQDRIACYPMFESIDVKNEIKVHPSTLRRIRFVADVHLGKLAKHLRMLGFDTLYREDYDDDELVEISLKQDRILLTRDKALAQRKELTKVFRIASQQHPRQLHCVLQRFDLMDCIQPLCLCLRCNAKILEIEKLHLSDKVNQQILQRHQKFFRCKQCGRIYWRGTHYRRMRQWIHSLKENRA